MWINQYIAVSSIENPSVFQDSVYDMKPERPVLDFNLTFHSYYLLLCVVEELNGVCVVFCLLD